MGIRINMKKVRVYGHIWSKSELTKAQRELNKWIKAFDKRMAKIRVIKKKYGTIKSGKGQKAYNKLPKLPKTNKKAMELSRQAHEAI